MAEIKRRNWSTVHSFSTPLVELSLEVSYHPELCDIVRANAGEPFEIMLGHIAAYCEVIVDGLYMPDELDKLCDKLTARLRQKRSLIVLPTSGRLH